ncbi:hypothetical protein BC628DRAFT_1326777, partial [Trametes gibbosa]
NQVSINPIKLKGILDWNEPIDVKGVWSFLGFGNFYRQFIDHFSDIRALQQPVKTVIKLVINIYAGHEFRARLPYTLVQRCPDHNCIIFFLMPS